MSVIFGIFNRNGSSVEKTIADTMQTKLSSWTPDDQNIYINETVALGHAMLWNTPESKHEKLPLESNACVLCMDARIDNREELFTELNLPSRPLEKIGDSEFILAAYIKWGEACPKYLLGDFSFAIWDKEKEHIFCARDHVGIKPFYYYVDDNIFVFSNQILSILAHPHVDTKLDDASIAKFLTSRGFVEKRETFFMKIKKLPSATTLRVTKTTLDENVYWKVEDIKPIKYNTYSEYVEELNTLIDNAVEARLRTCYPVASHLSGGLDSSAISVLSARKLKTKNIPFYAFNWIPIPTNKKDKKNCEWGYSREIIDAENIAYENVCLSTDAIERLYEKIDISTDDFVFLLEEYLVREKASKKYVRTILSGWGGDQLVSYDGYAYVSGLLTKGRFIKGIQEIYGRSQDKKNRFLYTAKHFIRGLIYPFFYQKMSGYYKVDTARINSFKYTQKDFTGFAKKLVYGSTKFCSGVHNEQKCLYKDGYILQRIESWALSTYTNKIEYAYPLLDKRIIEFALAIPEELYAPKNGITRLLFRNAIGDLLPKDILYADKYLDIEYDTEVFKLYEEFIMRWFEKNNNTLASEHKNGYIDRQKIIDRLKIYLSDNSENKNEGMDNILQSIILLNLKIFS